MRKFGLFSEFWPFTQMYYYIVANRHSATYVCVLCFLTDSIFFPSFKRFQKSTLPFPDFASFVAFVVLEQELIELHKTVFLRAESMSENTFTRIH